jgi:hypothetical protein
MSSTSYDIKLEELTEESICAEHPKDVKVRLRQHQLTLLNRCIQFENMKIPLTEFHQLHCNVGNNDYLRTQVGIIGDRVGSGKSYVILSLILENDITNRESSIKTFGNNKIVLCFSEKNKHLKTNLLVIPHNLAPQWDQSIKEFSENMKYIVVNVQKKVELLYQEEPRIGEYDLIVVTSTFYNHVAHFLTSRSFKLQRVFYDEVDNMNLPSCVSVDSNFYWFVTASIGNLLYPRGYHRWDYTLNKDVWKALGLRNAGFIKNLFMDLYTNLSRDFVKILIIKNDDDFVKRSISLPEIINHQIKCKTPMTINVLNGLVDRSVIDSLNAGDVNSALQYVNPNNKNTEDNLITMLIDKLIKNLHNLDVRIQFTQNLEFNNDTERQNELNRLTNKRREVQHKIDCIKDRIKSNNTCCICYDDIKNKTITPCCSNSYCFVCIHIWLARHTACPLCKDVLPSSSLLVVNEDNPDESSSQEVITEDDVNEAFDKIKNLEILLKLKLGEKILIFSSSESSLNNIVKILDVLNISHSFVKGHHQHIAKVVDRYKNGNLRVLLVNTRNYCSGMNLENTTDIVMLHKFDTEIEKQVIGRAHRYGREIPLHVWYLLYENEFH